jgi:hypothetical protein
MVYSCLLRHCEMKKKSCNLSIKIFVTSIVSRAAASDKMISRALLIAVAAMAGADAFAPAPALPSRLGLRASSSLCVNMRSDKIWTPLSARGNQPIRMMPEPPKPDQSPSKPSIPMPMVFRPFAIDFLIDALHVPA